MQVASGGVHYIHDHDIKRIIHFFLVWIMDSYIFSGMDSVFSLPFNSRLPILKPSLPFGSCLIFGANTLGKK